MQMKKNRDAPLTDEEKKIIQGLLNKRWNSQDIQHLINIGRKTTINGGRISEIKKSGGIIPATDAEIDFYTKKKHSYDYRTGLNFYDDERLIRSREAMILAVNVFNNAHLQFKTEVFSVLACIAWTYLLHEHYEKKNVKIIKDDGRSFLLSYMIRRPDFPFSDGIKNNLLFMINIRDCVEHKLLKKSDFTFFTKFQACCLNFNKALCDLFGDETSLEHELSFALQFAKLAFEQAVILSEFDIPEHIKALNIKLDENLTDAQKNDTEFQFKVNYKFESASKNSSHINFITGEPQEGEKIDNILVRNEIADDVYPYKAGKVCTMVTAKIGRKFSLHRHVQAYKLYKARPAGKSLNPRSTNKKWCIYHSAHKDYTYNQSWVDFLIEKTQNKAEWEKIMSYRDKK